jgi:CMP-N-acetylneuraminic acid synthetase
MHLAVIPARGGSKGLPRKNIRILNGMPLLVHTVIAANRSGCFSKIVVSSDDDEILEIAESCGAIPLRRPSYLAEDQTPMDPVLAHALASQKPTCYHTFCLLQPTSPLRSAERIRQAYELFEDHPCADGVFGVVPAPFTVQKAVVFTKDGTVRGLFGDRAPYMRRQDFEPAFFHNGAIYLCRTKAYEANGELAGLRPLPLIMTSDESLDVDEIEDFENAERMLRRNANEKL